MSHPKMLPIISIMAIALALAHITLAQNSPQDYLDAHNGVRAEVGIEPMTWNKTVADFAQQYAEKKAAEGCMMEHSNSPDYGENLAQGYENFNGVDAVKLWVNETQHYDYASNTCHEGEVCGHYTQVVWRNSVQLGCARVKCDNGWWFITCNYYPPGNYIGEKPY